jgi:hypothetical protein
MRMSKAGLAGALILITAAVVAANAQEKADSTATKSATTKTTKTEAVKTGPQTLVGEIVDPACYLINGAKGEPHKDCAIACAKAGQGLALLEKKTNKIYLLCTEQPGQDPNKDAINFVAQQVIVKGKVRSRGGALGIQVDSIEPYSAAKAGGK